MADRKLVRDRIPEIIAAEGRKPVVKKLEGAALIEALADMAEVIIALAKHYGADELSLLSLIHRKREKRGGFENGFLYCGEIAPET